MVDKFCNVPPPLMASGMVPPDAMLRMLACAYLWYDDIDVAAYLWESVRYEFRDRANTIIYPFDHRSDLEKLFPEKPG